MDFPMDAYAYIRRVSSCCTVDELARGLVSSNAGPAASAAAGVSVLGNLVDDGAGCKDGVEDLVPVDSAESGHGNPQSPGWTKRVRVGRARLDRTHCADRQSALEKLVRCYGRNWETSELFLHMHPYVIDMTGAEFMSQLGPDGELDMEGWAVIWRLLRQLDAKVFKGAFFCWRHVFEPQFAEELVSEEHADELDFEYLGTMLSEDHVGYSLANVKKLMLTHYCHDGWALYVVDVEKKHILNCLRK